MSHFIPRIWLLVAVIVPYIRSILFHVAISYTFARYGPRLQRTLPQVIRSSLKSNSNEEGNTNKSHHSKSCFVRTTQASWQVYAAILKICSTSSEMVNDIFSCLWYRIDHVIAVPSFNNKYSTNATDIEPLEFPELLFRGLKRLRDLNQEVELLIQYFTSAFLNTPILVWITSFFNADAGMDLVIFVSVCRLHFKSYIWSGISHQWISNFI